MCEAETFYALVTNDEKEWTNAISAGVPSADPRFDIDIEFSDHSRLRRTLEGDVIVLKPTATRKSS